MYTTATDTPAPTSNDRTRSRARTLWTTGAIAGVTGGTGALGTHLVAKAADVPLTVDGKEFPLFAFPQVALMATVVGVVIALVVSRHSSRPRHTFVAITVGLTLLSLVPPLALSTDAATKVTLEIAHVVAAAFVIPMLASKLAERDS